MNNSQDAAIVWFRQDLRIDDNPALHEAVKNHHLIYPIFILDDADAGEWCLGGASRWWLHHSLSRLDQSLLSNLSYFVGPPEDIFKKLLSEHEFSAVYANHCFEPWRIAQEQSIQRLLEERKKDLILSTGNLLVSPDRVYKDDGTPYKVFTPFYRKGCLKYRDEFKQPLSAPDLTSIDLSKLNDDSLSMLELMPTISWYEDIEKLWKPGEEGAKEALAVFIERGVNNYKESRNFPSIEGVSRLSPHLHFGEISPKYIYSKVVNFIMDAEDDKNIDHFFSEIGWREFSNNLLFHNPDLPEKNLNKKFDIFPWQQNQNYFKAWTKGITGIPFVDAGMRELWQTGYMHNRVRMVVGSFLVKNLLLDWRLGERWFWDTLLDADLANNSASWQWVAGCGADAAPYFRIFNPVTQGIKFDPEGTYIKKFIPELKNLDPPYLFSPWETDPDILKAANIRLGIDYPYPIIDLKASRESALEAFQATKN